MQNNKQINFLIFLNYWELLPPPSVALFSSPPRALLLFLPLTKNCKPLQLTRPQTACIPFFADDLAGWVPLIFTWFFSSHLVCAQLFFPLSLLSQILILLASDYILMCLSWGKPRKMGFCLLFNCFPENNLHLQCLAFVTAWITPLFHIVS